MIEKKQLSPIRIKLEEASKKLANGEITFNEFRKMFGLKEINDEALNKKVKII